MSGAPQSVPPTSSSALPPPLAPMPKGAEGAARAIAGGGAVIGLAGGLILWLAGFVGPVLFIPVAVVAAILGGVVFGVPAFVLERRANGERKVYQEKLDARAAQVKAVRRAELEQRRREELEAARRAPSASAPVVVVQVAPGQTATYGGVPIYTAPAAAAPSGTPTWTPLSNLGASASPAPSSTEGGPKAPTWPMTEPLCYMETGREKDVWDVVRQAQPSPDAIIGFTTSPPNLIASNLGLPVSAFWKVSRIEGDDTVDPGNLERIGNLIERHFDGGQGRIVVMPGLENLVEAGNVRNVRRLLEVLRDIAQSSKGSILVSLDPVSLPEASVTLLERGSHRLK